MLSYRIAIKPGIFTKTGSWLFGLKSWNFIKLEMSLDKTEILNKND